MDTKKRIMRVFEQYSLEDIMDVLNAMYPQHDIICELENLDFDLIPSDIQDELNYYRDEERKRKHYQNSLVDSFLKKLDSEKLSLADENKMKTFLEEMKL